MQTNIHDLIDKKYKTVEQHETLHKALNKFEGSKDVLIVKDKENNYKGILILKDALKAGVDSKHMQVKKIARKAPRADITETDYVELLRLMNENNLFNIPVFKNGDMVGVAHADKILQSINEEDIAKKKVKDIMTKDVKTLHPDNTVAQAITFLRDHAVSRIPLIEKGKISGIVTIQDILLNALMPRDKPGRQDYYTDKKKSLSTPLKDLMERNLITVEPQHYISTAVKKMLEKDVSGLLVEINDTLKGVITKKDVLKELYYQIRKQETEGQIMVQVSSKVENINREQLLQQLKSFGEKFSSQLGPGTINIHLNKHNEKLKGQPLIQTRLRIRCANANHSITGEGWGDLHSLRIVLRKARSLILKNHQDHGKKTFEEYMDYADLKSL